MRPITCIDVPNVLNSQPDATETFFGLIHGVPPCNRILLRCPAVSWMCPYGVVSLLGACRYLAQLSGESVQITGLRGNVHAYLRRIDFFERAAFVEAGDSFDPSGDWARSDASSSVLELLEIHTQGDIYTMGGRTRRILVHWLGHPYGQDDMDRIVSLLAEACSNVVDHSCDYGVVTIQKYERANCIDVELAISDLGKGIRRSLSGVHGSVSDSCSGFIEKALAGLSSRPGGRGGQGLGAIQRIATASGGSLHIRSETGSVLANTSGLSSRDDLSFFPGTQIAITFRSHR